MGLLLEAVVVGAILAAVLAVVAGLGPTTGFLAGAGVHLVFELVGANRWYCTHGAACRP